LLMTGILQRYTNIRFLLQCWINLLEFKDVYVLKMLVQLHRMKDRSLTILATQDIEIYLIKRILSKQFDAY
jgi:hypothetical protein